MNTQNMKIDILVIRDNRLDNIFKRFFKEVWESERYNISKF